MSYLFEYTVITNYKNERKLLKDRKYYLSSNNSNASNYIVVLNCIILKKHHTYVDHSYTFTFSSFF